MSEYCFLFYNDGNGKFEFYDSTYDITIHCKSKQEQDEAVGILRHANELKHTGVVMEPKNMADDLIAFCVNGHQTDDGCTGCPFGVNNDSSVATICGIYVPSGWNMPEDG